MKRDELSLSREFLGRHTAKGERVLCAVSGGLDSMCLLHLTCAWAKDRDVFVAAAHFNHQLRGEAADRDEAFVAEYCQKRKIPYYSGSGDTKTLAGEKHLSIEEAARTLRYAFLEKTADEGGFAHVLTAHHADDNAETMLINLCRGTGAAGLGIPPVRGKICRPFLEISRAELAKYAAAHSIPHVEDETNENDDAARNLLRHHVLPVLRAVNPRAAEHMARTARFLLEDSAALDVWAAEAAAQTEAVPGGVRIRTKLLEELPQPVRNRAILILCAQAGGHRKDLTAAHAFAVSELLDGPTKRTVSLPERLEAGREKNFLRICRTPEPQAPVPIAPGETVAFGSWTVSVTRKRPPGGLQAALNPAALTAPLQVTVWRPDDRMLLPGSRGERTLKRLCADAGLSPGQRDALPVLRTGERAAAVPAVGTDLRLLPPPGGDAVYAVFIQHTEENRNEK